MYLLVFETFGAEKHFLDEVILSHNLNICIQSYQNESMRYAMQCGIRYMSYLILSYHVSYLMSEIRQALKLSAYSM
jgi:hypothetical protein